MATTAIGRFFGLLAMALAVSAIPSNTAQAAYAEKGGVSLSSAPQLTAVDAYANPDTPNHLNPARPYYYTADATGLTVLRLADNAVLGTVAWPATYELALPDGTSTTAWAPLTGWQPMGLLVPYFSSEDIGPEAQTGADRLAFVEMARSGLEWQSSDGRLRDTIAPATSELTDSSLLLTFDVTDPLNPVVVGGALLGHNAGQMAWEPSGGAVYVGNMPSTSLPPDLESFISKITPPEVGGEPPPPYAPQTLYPLCGPEIEWSGELKEEGKMGIPVNVPESWFCDTIHGAGDGEGPFTYEFTGLPAWLTAHADSTGALDGLLYGTPTEVGTYTFVVTVTDHQAGPTDPATASAVVTLDVKPTVTEFVAGEWEAEAYVQTAIALYGEGDCTPTATIPSWFEVIQVPHGCVVIGTPRISGERLDFAMPGFTSYDYATNAPWPEEMQQRNWTGEIVGTYGFDPLPAGVGISGLAWHEVDMIPGEPDKYVINSEFIGIDPNTGQLYKDVLPYEQSDTIETFGPVDTALEYNELSAEGTPLAGSGFGQLVVEADRDIFVAASDAVIKVSGSIASTIGLPGMQASHLALDSDLAPAVKPDLGGPGQIDHGVLWATSPFTSDVAVIDTAAGTVLQTLSVAGAAYLGGVSVDSFSTGLAFVAAPSLMKVSLFGSDISWQTAPKLATINPAEALVDPTVMTVGEPGAVTVVATGWPTPSVSVSAPLPAGLTYLDNGNGTATVSGTPTAAGVYTLTATASNGVLPDAIQTFTLTVNARTAPLISSANTATLVVGIAGQFKVEATGTPTPVLSVSGALPAGVYFQDNRTGSGFLAGFPTSTGSYPLTITAANTEGVATQEFTLNVADAATLMAPAITAQPVSQMVIAGEAATFTSAASGTPAPTVQWQLSMDGGATWGDLFAETFTNYTTVATTAAMNGYQYRAMFTNAAGSAISSAAILTVTSSAAPAFTSASEVVFVVGSAMSFTVMATGSPAPSLSYTGTLPAGVAFADNGGGMATFAGTSNVAGSYGGVITATSEAGSATQAFTLTVQLMAVTTTSLPDGKVNVSYSYQLEALGGIQPYTWSVPRTSQNKLPPGLSLSSSGVISGSANRAGTYDFTVQVKDARARIASRALALTVADEFLNPGGPVKVNLQAGLEPEGIAVNPVTHSAYILSEDSAGVKHVVVIDNSVLNATSAPKALKLPPKKEAVLIPIANEHEYLAIDSTRNLIYVPTEYAAAVIEDDDPGEPPEPPKAEIMGTLTVIDGDTNAVLTSYQFPPGYLPEAVAVDPVNNVVYVGVKLPEPGDPTGCPIDPVSGQAECEMTGGMIYAFNAANVRGAPGTLGTPIAGIRAEEPESVVFEPVRRLVYAANEGKGTTTIFNALDSSGHAEGSLMGELRIFRTPNPYALPCSPYEADKMAVGSDGSVYITDDKSRVAKISGTVVRDMVQIDLPGGDNTDLYCYGEEPLQGLNTANNIAFMKPDAPATPRLYVVSEQGTVSILDPDTMALRATIVVPGAYHLDAIGVDGPMNRVWITDEALNAVFVLGGACANGTGGCAK